MRPTRFAIVATHPIQYQAPWFRAMAAHPDLDPHVYYCHVATPEEQARAGFGVEFDWDVPLLEGYPYTVLRNVAERSADGAFNRLDTPEIREIIARERYDAVIVLGWQVKSFWQAIWACWRTGTPVLVRGDSHLHTGRPTWKRAAKSIPYRVLMPRFDAYLAAGTWSREYFLHYGAPRNRIFQVPHVIDEHMFTQLSDSLRAERASLRYQWGIRDEQVAYLFAAKFTEIKRPLDFAKAVEAAASRDPRVVGAMVGDGPLRVACEDYARGQGVPIRFTGFLNQSEIVQAYVAADALVLLSDETWGMVVNEAFACGLPCIVSDQVGCAPDLIAGRETGAIFPYTDMDRLAAVLGYYADTHDLLTTMGERAREVSREFRPAVAANGVAEALAAAVKTGGQHASYR